MKNGLFLLKIFENAIAKRLRFYAMLTCSYGVSIDSLGWVPVEGDGIRILFNTSFFVSKVIHMLWRVNTFEFAFNLIYSSAKSIYFDIRDWWKYGLFSIFFNWYHIPVVARNADTLIFALFLKSSSFFFQSKIASRGSIVSSCTSDSDGPRRRTFSSIGIWRFSWSVTSGGELIADIGPEKI